MSSYDKVVKLACKPKAAPPKAKYLDTIIAATWSEDGAVHDVCKALSPRFREPNAIVVFKALIVLHTMIRNGATDNVLSYLSSSEVLRLQNVSAGNWEGYNAPQNLQNYAIYLDSRIRAYHDLKHDAVRVQAESNRDLRNSNSIEEDGYRTRNSGGGGSASKATSSAPTRSKTIMGRKLRVMTVEKGLLRETKAVHRMIDSLVECRFYLDDLEDELTTTALRMLVKDLLILFQAGNEGVINVLEHYFEMSHIDAQQALSIYRHFCKQTERVVEYLGVAKKLQNLLNVPIPNLKHAPVSLAGALQEYLDDPNFEQNRIEYRSNKEVVEGGAKKGGPGSRSKKVDKSSPPKAPAPALPKSSSAAPISSPGTTSGAPVNAKPDVMVDFFSAIEEEQPTMFNPQTNSPNAAYFQQQASSNPFVQRQMITGQPFGMQQVPQIQGQPTGFVMPQQTAFQQSPPNPFGLQPQQAGHRPFSSFLQPQATGFFHQPQMQSQQQQQPTGLLQPQPTGSNPFRQSMMFPQSTGMAMFGAGTGGQGGSSGPFHGQGQGFNMSAPPTSAAVAFSPSPSFTSPFAQQPSSAPSNTISNLPARPASTPLTSFGSSASSPTSPPPAQPVKTHQTGTKNPFGPVVTTPPPVPRQPTLMELAMGVGVNHNHNGILDGTPGQGGGKEQQIQQSGPFSTTNGFHSSALSPGATDISSVASSFAFNQTNGKANENKAGMSGSGLSYPNPPHTQNPSSTSTSSGSTISTSLSSHLPGVTSTFTPPTSVSTPLKPQSTGFAGLKPFKPSSSFGASLLESLPPIPGSNPSTPAVTGNTTSPGAGGMSSGGTSGLGLQRTGFGAGSTLGTGLRPQITGGAANPFRASMVGSPTGGAPNFGGGTPFVGSGQSSPFSGVMGVGGSSGVSNSTGANLFGGGAGVGVFGSSFNPMTGQHQQQQPQNASSSLI